MVTPEELAEVLEYKDGELYWKKKVARKIIVGTKAGSTGSRGYFQVRYKSRAYRKARVVWCLCHGEWPPEGLEVDHINQNKADDRIENLRLVTRWENAVNQKHKGYRKRKDRFSARITVHGKVISLGTYGTEEEAIEAYNKAKNVYHINETSLSS